MAIDNSRERQGKDIQGRERPVMERKGESQGGERHIETRETGVPPLQGQLETYCILFWKGVHSPPPPCWKGQLEGSRN